MTGIPDEAVDAAWDAALAAGGKPNLPRDGQWRLEVTRRQFRAGLAAALPHLAAAIRHDDASEAPQIAADASEGAGGRPGPETGPQPATGDDRRPGWLLPPSLVAAQPRTGGHSPAASPDQPDAAQTASGPRVPPSREVAHAEIADRTHPDVTAHAKYAYDVLRGHRPDTTQEA